MKYYYREHLAGYEQVVAEGKTSWSDIQGGDGCFENFPSRPFLEKALPRLVFDSPRPRVLEYGCGTGPGACFLAARGFAVDAIDLIPAAVEIARKQAAQRHLDIRFDVMDVCSLPANGEPYDLIVDSYCLQGIVLDAERQRLFAAVQARLAPAGYYLVSSAVFNERNHHPDEIIRDEQTDIVYHRYWDDGLIDADGIAYETFPEKPEGLEPIVRIAGRWCMPYRRHRTPAALRAELESAGFSVLLQDVEHFACVLADSPACLRD
jgi:SAM-dependent methyltransferase